MPRDGAAAAVRAQICENFDGDDNNNCRRGFASLSHFAFLTFLEDEFNLLTTSCLPFPSHTNCHLSERDTLVYKMYVPF